MTTATRWGILGTGSIAKQFARGLADTPDAVLQSVGSRAQDSADAFGEAFSIPTRHASYEALANDPEVDAIYVSTPHPFHKDNSILCLRAGKAVLCEKPFTINAAEAKAVVEVAREHGVFLMEAMWSRFFPAMRQVKKWLDEGAIGKVRLVNADFGFRAGINPEGRLFNPALAVAPCSTSAFTRRPSPRLSSGPPDAYREYGAHRRDGRRRTERPYSRL